MASCKTDFLCTLMTILISELMQKDDRRKKKTNLKCEKV